MELENAPLIHKLYYNILNTKNITGNETGLHSADNYKWILLFLIFDPHEKKLNTYLNKICTQNKNIYSNNYLLVPSADSNGFMHYEHTSFVMNTVRANGHSTGWYAARL